MFVSSSGMIRRMSACLLSVVSPVFHRSLCGTFREREQRSIVLDEVHHSCFDMLLDLAFGSRGVVLKSLQEAVSLAVLADRIQILVPVGDALEAAIARALTPDAAAELLMCAAVAVVPRAAAAARALLLAEFEPLSRTPAFLRWSEALLADLLADDRHDPPPSSLFLSLIPFSFQLRAHRSQGSSGAGSAAVAAGGRRPPSALRVRRESGIRDGTAPGPSADLPS